MSNDPLPARSTFVCPSCGTESLDKFCSSCGERKLGSEDRSLRRYLDVVANLLTHFDSKGYRSLWYLLTKPGFLSEEYLRGRRVRYPKPISLFVSINVVYYLSISLFGANTFTTPLSVQLHGNNYYSGFASRKVESRLKADVMSYATLEAKHDKKAGVLSKTLIFLFIPIYAIIFYGLFFTHRRYFVDHAVVATHLWSFILLLLAVLVPAIAAMMMWWSGAPSIEALLAAHDNPISVFLQICIGVYMALMLRRVYAASYWYCATVAVVISWSFFHIVWLYRFLLFVITLRFV
jgi:Protein of unknown function (DUF3667)